MTPVGADRQAGAGSLPPVRFVELVGVEWTKLRSVRSTVWSLAATVVAGVGVSVLATSVYTAQWSTLAPADRAHMQADPIGLILQPGFVWAQLVVMALGVLTVAGEFSTGAIRSSLLAVPSRARLLAAKTVSLVVVAFCIGELVAVVDFLIGRAVIERRVAVALGDPGVLRALLGAGAFLALMGVFGVALGALIRHVGGAVSAALGALVVVPTVANFLPGRLGEDLGTFLPGGTAGSVVMSADGAGELVGPWAGLGVCAAWAVLFIVVAAVVLDRRGV